MARPGARYFPGRAVRHDMRQACGPLPARRLHGLSYMLSAVQQACKRTTMICECREIEPLLMEHDRGQLIEPQHTLLERPPLSWSALGHKGAQLAKNREACVQVVCVLSRVRTSTSLPD